MHLSTSVTTATKHPVADRLRRELEGDVRFDPLTRAIFSSDASIYQITPIGVVFPKHAEDVRRIVEITSDEKLALLPRGGGTSLAGQTVGEAVVIDFSKYMNNVLEVNAEEHWARIQPGVVLDNFNTLLRPTGLMFGPEVSPSSRATLGGMMGNNSCGSRSIQYGKMVDHVLELQGFLASASLFKFGKLTSNELERTLQQSDQVSKIIQTVNQLAITHRDEIEKRFPKIMRRVAGYNLDQLNLEDGFNLAGLLVGSQGTLAVNVEAKVSLVSRPKHAVLGVCHFNSFSDSMHASDPIVGLKPHAIELSDKLLVDLARDDPAYQNKLHFVRGNPEALLIVEFAGESETPLLRKLDDLEILMRDHGYGDNVVRVLDAAKRADVWAVRKAGLGLFGSIKGDAKPIAFVEDTAVSPEKLPDFTAEFREILDRHGVRAAFYGHASVGCLHIRPMLDLRRQEEIRKLRAIAEEITDLSIRYGGSHSAEHGEGLARAEFNPKVFGETLYAAFKDVKHAFDPQGRMNPGKKVNAPPMDENLRLGPDYTTSFPAPVLDYSDFGGMDKAIEMCNGNGQCRKSEVGTMCPSYMVTLDEMHSTRGRANALRMAIAGEIPREMLFSEEMYEIMDLCISCKGCKFECPSHVDMAKHKYEFLVGYFRRHGVPIRSRLLGNIHRLSAFTSKFAPLSNLPTQFAPLRSLVNRLLGLHPNRTLPAVRRDTFWSWWKQRQTSTHTSQGRVVLFADTFSNYYEPEIPKAAVHVLEAAGYEVVVPEPSCCGRTLISEGLHEQALNCTRQTSERLRPYVERGDPIVGLEPSCILTFRDEYPYLLKNQEAVELSDRAMLIEEFLAEQSQRQNLNLKLKAVGSSALLHGHCHQKAIATTASAHQLLSLIPELGVKEIDSGCCGMAGSFGYEAEHYPYSMAIGERVLLPTVRETPPETIIIADGTSCRHQISDGTGRNAIHLIQLLERALTTP